MTAFAPSTAEANLPAAESVASLLKTGADLAGKPLGWMPPPAVVAKPSADALMKSSPVALAGGAVGLKSLLFAETGTAFAAAPAASAGLIGLAFLAGIAVGAGIDCGIGALLKDEKVDTLSEWLATKWSEASSLPVPGTSGWRYIPYDAPSGPPTDPAQTPGIKAPPVTAPAYSSGDEMETASSLKKKKPEAIGDRRESGLFFSLTPSLHPPRGLNEVKIGRDPNSDFMVNHPAVSNEHATLLRPVPTQNTWEIADHSLNGVFVNGHKVEGKQEIKFGDEVSTLSLEGRLLTLFRLGDPTQGEILVRDRFSMLGIPVGPRLEDIVSALNRIGSDPRFRGFSQELLHAPPDVALFDMHSLLDFIGRIVSHPDFNGDFDGFIEGIRNLQQNYAVTIRDLLSMIGSNPNFRGDFDALMMAIHRSLPRNWVTNFGHSELAEIAVQTNPNFNGDFHLFGSLPIPMLNQPVRDEIVRMTQESFTDFMVFLEKSPNFLKPLPKLNGRIVRANGPVLAARLFAHFASQPNLSPPRREALADAIIGGLSHSNPKIREAFRKVSPNIAQDKNISPWVRDFFRDGAK